MKIREANTEKLRCAPVGQSQFCPYITGIYDVHASFRTSLQPSCGDRAGLPLAREIHECICKRQDNAITSLRTATMKRLRIETHDVYRNASLSSHHSIGLMDLPLSSQNIMKLELNCGENGEFFVELPIAETQQLTTSIKNSTLFKSHQENYSGSNTKLR